MVTKDVEVLISRHAAIEEGEGAAPPVAKTGPCPNRAWNCPFADLEFRILVLASGAEDPDSPTIGEQPGLLVTPEHLAPVADAPLEVVLRPFDARLAVTFLDRCAAHSHSPGPAILGPEPVSQRTRATLDAPLATDPGQRLVPVDSDDLQKSLIVRFAGHGRSPPPRPV